MGIPYLNKVVKAAKVVTAPITLPTRVVINVATGKDPLDPVKDTISDAGKLANLPNTLLINLAHNALGDGIVGDVGKVLAEIAFAGNQYSIELAKFSAFEVIDLAGDIASGDTSIKDLLTGDLVLRGAVIGLASAISVAANEFAKIAKPIPQNVRYRLAPYYPTSVIDRAKYAIGSLGINLPEVINFIQKTKYGHEHAVTVDNVIVFTREPSDDEEGIRWWAHEIQHVTQYSEWGISKFAYKYIANHRSVEAQAESKAQEILAAMKGAAPAIDQKYAELIQSNPWIGQPVSGGICADGAGRYQHYEGRASIFWHPQTGAHLIYGLIRDKYAALGWERSPVGYPTTDEADAGSGLGRCNDFQNGSILWKHGANEAFAVYGAILSKWGEQNWDNGFLGFPMTDETGAPDQVGRFNHFEGGSIYWAPQTGAHFVIGAILQAWGDQGWETGRLGYPVTDELATEGTDGGRRSQFQGGEISWTPEGGATTNYY